MVARVVYNLVRWCNARRREGDGPRARLSVFVPDALLHSVWNLTMPNPHRVNASVVVSCCCWASSVSLLPMWFSIASLLAYTTINNVNKSIPSWMWVVCDVTEGTCMSPTTPLCQRQVFQPGVGCGRSAPELRANQEPPFLPAVLEHNQFLVAT